MPKLPVLRSPMAMRAALVAGFVAVVMAACPPAGRAAPAAPPPFQTVAPSAILMDADNGTVLFAKNADVPVAPASTTKVMTAEIVFRQLAEGRLKLDDKFVVSVNAWRSGGAPSGGSAMFAAVNSQVRVEDLIRGLVIDSGNDAAIALAEGIAGTEDAFASMMTLRARELGLPTATFVNAWGRGDPAQKISAREMAQLAIHVIATYPQYYRYFGEREFTWNKVRQTNRNPLLPLAIGADGLKTGEIAESGYNIVASAVQNGQRLVLVLDGMKTARDRVSEAVKMLNWGFRSFERRTLFTAGQTVGTARVFGGAVPRVPLVAAKPVELTLARGAAEPLTAKVVYEGPLPAPVQADAQLARLKVFKGDAEVLDVPLRTAAAVEVGPLPGRALDAGWELAAGLVRTAMQRR